MDAIENLTQRVKDLTIQHAPRQYYMEPCQPGSKSKVSEAEKAYLAEMEDILRLLSKLCEDDTTNDAAAQYYVDVPADTPTPAGPTMLSKLHDLQKGMDELRVLFNTPCPPDPRPRADNPMETYYEPNLAPAETSADARKGPEVYADNRTKYEVPGEEDSISWERPCNLADDTFDYEPRPSCPALANENPPPKATNPEPLPAAAPRPTTPAAAAPRAREIVHWSASPGQDHYGDFNFGPQQTISAPHFHLDDGADHNFYMDYSPPPTPPSSPPWQSPHFGTMPEEVGCDDLDTGSDRVVPPPTIPLPVEPSHPGLKSPEDFPEVIDLTGNDDDIHANLPTPFDGDILDPPLEYPAIEYKAPPDFDLEDFDGGCLANDPPYFDYGRDQGTYQGENPPAKDAPTSGAHASAQIYAFTATTKSPAIRQRGAVPETCDDEGVETALHTIMKHRGGGTQPCSVAVAI